MKPLLLSSLIATSIFAFASTDVSNANILAGNRIITKQTNEKLYRLDDTITRAEVVGTALKFRGVTLPENYKCKKYFTDVTNDDWICRAVEIGADLGFVSRTNTTYRPQANITRAEALAMMYQASNLESKLITDWEIKLQEILLTKNINLVAPKTSWQETLIKKAYYFGIIDSSLLTPIKTGSASMQFRENSDATRAEVFSIAKKAFDVRAVMSGEVTL